MSSVTTDAVPLRMDPQRRREQLLDVAADYITEHGVDVSLDDIAREARISPPLMRHYFKNRDGLLVALFERMLEEVLPILTTPSEESLDDRLVRYLDWTAARPWGHRLWMAASTKELALAPLVTDARRLLISAAHATRWEDQDPDQRFRANAWVAVIESSVQNWLTDGTPDRDQLVGLLLDIAARLDIPAARQALRGWRRRAAKT
jgi:AcrR family transcriptional regulator